MPCLKKTLGMSTSGQQNSEESTMKRWFYSVVFETETLFWLRGPAFGRKVESIELLCHIDYVEVLTYSDTPE